MRSSRRQRPRCSSERRDEAREGGRDPEARSYSSFISFGDPDGNGWVLQELTERLPGR
jgi:hypothetical protein